MTIALAVLGMRAARRFRRGSSSESDALRARLSLRPSVQAQPSALLTQRCVVIVLFPPPAWCS